MNSNVVKVTLIVMAVLASGTFLTQAQAGNASVPSAMYFSVSLDAGERLFYSGAGSATLLIDDVTYTAQIDPCNLYDRCEFFTADDLVTITNEPISQSESTFNTDSSPSAFLGLSFAVTTMQKFTNNGVITKGAYLSAQLSEGPAGSQGGDTVFDAFSHSIYGQFANKYKDISTTFTKEVIHEFPGPDPLNDHEVYGYGWSTHALSDSIAMSQWAVPTSESRHYQSPQIVQPGANVIFLLETALSDYGSYVNARVYIKGRVVDDSSAPTESFDVSVASN